MKVGVITETFPGERRVGLVPAVIPILVKAGLEVIVQAGAGAAAGFADQDYQSKGAAVTGQRSDVFAQADILCQVRIMSANPRAGETDGRWLHKQHTVIGLADPLNNYAAVQRMADTGVRSFALELIPRITRAQAMDVLSSQATIAGYKAVLLAANHLPRMFPMMMTAAGTIAATRVFVIGAGVAGLQAIATAKKMGGVVQAYDIRPAVKEQIESLGARFVHMDLATGSAEGTGGYAKAMDEEFYRRQRELMATVVAQCDVVVTTAAVPGAKPPVLVTADMVRAMPRGAVVVDLAARPGASGGNCELTRPDETVTVAENGAVVLGPTNLPATVPHSASQMFARNMTTFIQTVVKKGELNIDMDDEIIAGTLLTQGGKVIHPSVLHHGKTAA